MWLRSIPRCKHLFLRMLRSFVSVNSFCGMDGSRRPNASFPILLADNPLFLAHLDLHWSSHDPVLQDKEVNGNGNGKWQWQMANGNGKWQWQWQWQCQSMAIVQFCKTRKWIKQQKGNGNEWPARSMVGMCGTGEDSFSSCPYVNPMEEAQHMLSGCCSSTFWCSTMLLASALKSREE